MNDKQDQPPSSRGRTTPLPPLETCVGCVCVVCYGGCRSSEGQAQQHQQWDEFVSSVHIRLTEVAIIAPESHQGGLQHISQLQEVEGNHGGGHDGQLHTHTRTER